MDLPLQTPRSNSLSAAFLTHTQSLAALQTQLKTYVQAKSSDAHHAGAEELLDSKLLEVQEAEKTKKMMAANAEIADRMHQLRKQNESLQAELSALRDTANPNSGSSSSSAVYGLIDLLLILQPNLVINHIASPDFAPTPHFTMHPNTTLLFADISGYTALAQTLGAAGAHGTEMLSQSLDDFFGIAISVIYKYNGDVIKFCGDAILCVFEPDRATTPKAAAEAATRCALELKAKLRFFQAAEGVVLDLKQMLSHGDIVGNYVGDKTLNHFEFLITGEALAQIAATEHYVVPGDIILSKEMHLIISSVVAVKDVKDEPEAAALGFKLLVDLQDSTAAPPPSAAPNNVRLSNDKQQILELFNEPSVVEKLVGFAGGWSRLTSAAAAMRSRVSRHDLCTIVFISIDSEKLNSPDPQTNLDGLNDAFLSFYSPTKLFGGTLRQFLTDDKGTVAIIVFSGRESNTISACRCALRIQENFSDHGISSNIGIATGKVFFGPVGDERRCEMAWIGDSVNLAARLMGKAKDTVMVDKATCENASSEITFEMFGMVELKGKGAVALYELQGLKHRGSVLSEGRRSSMTLAANAKFTTRPQIFDNAVSILPCFASEISLNNAKSKAPLAHSTCSDRDALLFTIATPSNLSSDEFSPFMSLLRDSIVDFGGELISCSPLTALPPYLHISGTFLTGELPIRQSGGAKNHVDNTDVLVHFSSFISYLLTDDSFLDTTSINGVSLIVAIAASLGAITIDTSSSEASITLTIAPALEETHEILTSLPLCGISPTSPRVFCTPSFTSALKSIESFSALSPSSYNPPAPHKPFHDITSISDDTSLTNPGIGMPLSFVRRFHNDTELAYANTWMSNGLSKLLQTTLAAGDPVSRASSVLFSSCVVSLTFAATTTSVGTGTGTSTASTARKALASFRAAISHVASSLAAHDGGIFSTSTTSTHLHLLIYLPLSTTAASFFTSKLAAYLSSPPRSGLTNVLPNFLFAIIHNGDIGWNAGVNGSVVPHGDEVDDIAKQNLHLLSLPPSSNNIFVHKSAAPPTSSSRLISFHPIPDHLNYLAPRDVLTSAISTIFAESEMAGRKQTRNQLSLSLERLLLTNSASLTILEARAGFGKSMVAKEVVQVAAALDLPHLVIRTSSEDESNLGVFTTLSAHLLATLPPDSFLLDHLPPECTILELSFLNEYLPPAYRVAEKDLKRELGDEHDILNSETETGANTANSAVKIQLFNHLLRSLLLVASPFILVIEDLQWLDSASWKLLVMASTQWSHGVMLVVTTRPVPNHAAHEYAELCKADMATRELLGPLDPGDLAHLAKRFLTSEDGTKATASLKILDRLKKNSHGFPFLATELLRDAKSDLASSLLGSDNRPESSEVVHSRELVSTKDEYTNEEIAELKMYYEWFKPDSNWIRFQIADGVEYFDRADDYSSIRQGKAEGVIPNCSPYDILTEHLASAEDMNHLWAAEVNPRAVLETFNDHSKVIRQENQFPSPFAPRETVCRYVWKEMSPGVILYVNRSIEHEKAPARSDFVRANVKIYGYVWRQIPNSNATHETLLMHSDPGGMMPSSAVNYVMQAILSSSQLHIEYFAAKEDRGVPLLKSLVKKRIEKTGSKKLLGILAIMGTAVTSRAQLSALLQQTKTAVSTTLADLDKAELLEAVEGSDVPNFRHKFIADVAIASLDEEDRTSAHKTAAEALLKEFNSDNTNTQLLSGIASHFAGAQMLEDARLYSYKAAKAALRHNNATEAKLLLEQLLKLVKSGGPSRTAPSDDLYSLAHEELFCLVNLSRHDDAIKLIRSGPHFRLLPTSARQGAKLQRIKKLGVHPSVKIIGATEKAFLELRARLWQEVADKSRTTAKKTSYLGHRLRQLDAGIECGKQSESFVLSVLHMARYFTSVNDSVQANRLLALSENHMPDTPSRLLEGWVRFSRGELLASEGGLEEAVSYLNSASEEWFEGGHFELWVLSCKNLVLTQCLQGHLSQAVDFLTECEEKASSVRSTDSVNKILELQLYVNAECGEVKVAEELIHKLDNDIYRSTAVFSNTSGVSDKLFYAPFLSLMVAESQIEPATALRDLDRRLQTLPKFMRDWTWSFPIYWGVKCYGDLIKIGRERGKDVAYTSKLVKKMALLCRQMKDLAKRFKCCEATSFLCEGYLAAAQGNEAKACDKTRGGFVLAARSGADRGMALVEARSKMALAELSREPLPAKISMAMSALEVFQKSKAFNDTITCLLLLSQLDPKSTEFREMARNNMRRKSSSRKSKGNSDMVVSELTMMEDVPLAGRKEELKMMIKAANALRTTSGAAEELTIVLQAAGGMGKSALLKSFMKDVRLSMHGLAMFTSASSQFEKSTPFFIWKKIFDGMLQLFQTKKKENGRGAERVVAQEVLMATLGDLVGTDRARDWHPLLNPMLPFDFPDTPQTAQLSSSARLSQSLDFFYEILINQKGKTLISLEDAHWADELSWGLIERCHDAPDVLVVMTTRPEDDHEENAGALREFWELEGIEVVSLGALEEGALRSHIAGLLEVEQISEQLLKLIENRTGGNLLYIQELVSSLIESGMLMYNDTSVDLKNDVDELVVPDNVQAVIASRLAGLSPSQQSLLQTASVIGREFTLHMVVEVHPASEMLGNMANDMKEIVRKRLVERVVGNSGGEDGSGLQFSHKFVQESIYQSCLVSTRKQVHKMIAKHLEIDKSDQLSNFYGIIAHHYLQADEARSACLYLQLSSEVNEKLEMPSAVVDALKKWADMKLKLKLAGTGAAINGRFETSRVEEGIVYVTLAKALNKMLKFQESFEYCLLAAERLGTKVPRTKSAKIRLVVKGFAKLQYKAVTGGEFNFDANPTVRSVAYSDAVLLGGGLAFRRLDDTLSFLSATMLLATEYANVRARLDACFGLVLVAPAIGLWGIYDLAVRETNRLAVECEDQSVGNAILNNVNGIAYGSKGELKQSAAFFLKSSAEFLKLRETEMWANTHVYCAMAMFENGLGGKAAGHLRRGLSAAMEMNNSAALALLCSVVTDQLAFGSDGDIAAFSEIYENDVVKLLEPEGQYKLTSWPLMQWRIGQFDEDEAMKDMVKMQGVASWVPSHMYTGDRVGSTFGFLEIFDHAEATGKTSIGGVELKDVLGFVIVNCKFLEGLAATSAYVLPWALLFRGCVLRRENRAGEALKVILQGIEAASKSSSRACLSYLWLEKGLCQEKGKGSVKRDKPGKGSFNSGAPVLGEGEGEECVRSYNTSVDLAMDCGLHAIAAKGRKQLRGLGIERADGSQGGLSRSESALISGTQSLSRSNSSLMAGSEWSAGLEGGGGGKKKGMRRARGTGASDLQSGASSLTSGVSRISQGSVSNMGMSTIGIESSGSRGGEGKNSSLIRILSREGGGLGNGGDGGGLGERSVRQSRGGRKNSLTFKEPVSGN